MASSAIRNLLIGYESVYGSNARAGNYNSQSIYAAEFADVSQLLADGQSLQWTYADSRPGFWNAVPEVARYTGTTAKVATGSITLDFLLRSAGGTRAADTLGLMRLLRTRFSVNQAYYGSETVTASTTGSLSGLSDTSIAYGDVIARTLSDGRVVYGVSRSSGTTSPNITPAASYATTSTSTLLRPRSSGTIRATTFSLMSNYVDLPYDPVAGQWTRNSCVLRISGDGWTQWCCGCSLTSLRISPDPDGAIRLSCTLDCASIQATASTSATSTFQPAVYGPLLRASGSPHLVGRWQTATLSPLSDPLYCRNWSVQIDWTTAKNADGASDYAGEPPEAIDCSCVAECEYVNHPTLTSSLISYPDSYYSVVLPFGGRIDTANGVYYGGAVQIPQAALDNYGLFNSPDVAGDQVCRRCRWRASNNQTTNLPAFSLLVI